MRLRDSLDYGEAQLRAGPHPNRARRDAETLLLHHLGKNRAWLLAHLDDEFAGCRSIGYIGLIDRRVAGEPIQYITGETEFYGLPFHVTPDVLIPRPETEHLVERVLELAGQISASRRTTLEILDIGTGSGAIAVALAHHLPAAHITATDLSAATLDIARKNAGRNAVADCIRFLQGDLLAPVSGEVFDLIVSNPPYVPSTDRSTLSVEVREHEPALALFAGADGLDIYRRLIPSAFSALAHGGFLLLEIGYGQAPAIRALLNESSFSGIQFVPDLQCIPRVAVSVRP
ncbi:MAG TPA: peptide chain release factor N(5)-glutamine methyltransferase [Terracidiphilus sp.]|jgi:release factor glutamine methyltransferase|nr:peptide chain release factor N(5)-glutamine methyltransferase [Terracidiphilus sp.]